jgi:hypothetical protein
MGSRLVVLIEAVGRMDQPDGRVRPKKNPIRFYSTEGSTVDLWAVLVLILMISVVWLKTST